MTLFEGRTVSPKDSLLPYIHVRSLYTVLHMPLQHIPRLLHFGSPRKSDSSFSTQEWGEGTTPQSSSTLDTRCKRPPATISLRPGPGRQMAQVNSDGGAQRWERGPASYVLVCDCDARSDAAPPKGLPIWDIHVIPLIIRKQHFAIKIFNSRVG